MSKSQKMGVFGVLMERIDFEKFDCAWIIIIIALKRNAVNPKSKALRKKLK